MGRMNMRAGWGLLISAMLITVFSAAPALRAADTETDYPVIRQGHRVSSSVDVSNNGSGFRTFTFHVPNDTFAVRLSISNAPADLDLFLQHGREIQSYEYVDSMSASEDYNETLFVSRLSDPPLQDGRYYVDVVYQRATVPFHDWERLKEVPFELSLELISVSDHRSIEPDTTYRGSLSPEDGMAEIFAVELPPGLERCRVDVFDTIADLDLLVGYERPVLTRSNADYVKESLLGRESVVIDGSKEEPELPGGTYYITVFDQVSKEHRESYSLRVSLGSRPPAQLRRIPSLPRTDDELEQALYSTVEIIGEAGKGSGCLVSEDGLILTNWHVVRGFNGEPSEPIYVAVNYSPQKPPTEMFRAEVVEHEEDSDFALLQIVSGLYGQRIPRNFRFPYFSLGDPDSLTIGQPLSFLGYPGIGGTGSRASISLTRGIVSGFERSGDRFLIKTDAVIHNGNSGGAAVNAYWELLGLPTVVIGRESVSIGFVNPVSEIPESWNRLIERRNR
jgi:S1-C subfamily serine protease